MPLSYPASISTTSIIAAWLTANAPILTNEIVFEKYESSISKNSKNVFTKNIPAPLSKNGFFFNTFTIGCPIAITISGTTNIIIRITLAGSLFSLIIRNTIKTIEE